MDGEWFVFGNTRRNQTLGLAFRESKQASDPRIAAFDAFCGCGGMTRGLLDAGITVLRGVDIDTRVKDLYEQNNSSAKIVQKNVRSSTLPSILGKIPRSKF